SCGNHSTIFGSQVTKEGYPPKGEGRERQTESAEVQPLGTSALSVYARYICLFWVLSVDERTDANHARWAAGISGFARTGLALPWRIGRSFGHSRYRVRYGPEHPRVVGGPDAHPFAARPRRTGRGVARFGGVFPC